MDSIIRANVAFKCNFCDGGSSSEQVGFNGVCSDAVIRNNIKTKHRTWCASEDCPCFHYLDNKISRNELDNRKKDNYTCYESYMLSAWKALAGTYQTKGMKGQPKKLGESTENGLCVLTTRDTESAEEGRYIFAVFLINKVFRGDEKEEGCVSSNSEYRIKLSPKEARSLLFWNYHVNKKGPQRSIWNSGLYRYFDNMQAAEILKDIAKIKIGTPEEQLAKNFYNHFCSINSIDCSLLGKPCGVLKRKLI